MKIEHLEERVTDYKKSIDVTIKKKVVWKETTKDLLVQTLKSVVDKYPIGWKVQELNWIQSNEAVNITFDSFPPDFIEKTNQIPSYQFIQGATLVFTQSYNGDVNVMVLFPIVENSTPENSSIELGIFSPIDITEKLIIEKIDEFLKAVVKWEVPSLKNKLGF